MRQSFSRFVCCIVIRGVHECQSTWISEQVCKVIWVIANHHFTRRAKRPRPKIAAALYQFQEKEREKASQIRNAAKPMHGVGAYLSVVPAVALRSLSLSLYSSVSFVFQNET